MTAKSKYYVIKKTPCSVCLGTGGTKYENTSYKNGIRLTCANCQGRGYFTEEVDLAQVLTEIATEVEASLATLAMIRGNDK